METPHLTNREAPGRGICVSLALISKEDVMIGIIEQERFDEAIKGTDLTHEEFFHAIVLEALAMAIAFLDTKEKAPSIRDAAKLAEVMLIVFNLLALKNKKLTDNIYVKSVLDRFVKKYPGIGKLKHDLLLEGKTSGDLQSLLQKLSTNEKLRKLFVAHYERAAAVEGDGFVFQDVEIPLEFGKLLVETLPFLVKLQEAISNNERPSSQG